MWKLIVGFVVFAGLAMFVLMRGGEIDMSGEKHGVEVEHAAPHASSPAPAPAAAPASAPVPVADAASAPVAAAPASAAK